MTLALILANVFVFAFLQSGDERILQNAMAYYEQSDLGRVEFPAYADWLRTHAADARQLQQIHEASTDIRIGMIESDAEFLDALDAGRIITPDMPGYADWHAKRVEFERIRDSTFTLGHALRFSHFEPGRMFSSMFLHGGVDHILGNMIFLAILGLLVEGALGPWWFLGLYLLGGTGATLVSLAWHWGDHGYGLGASGAIAALIGAYAVLWGRRKVRVFYWFFVVFDYTRVPALILLPVWFGWQVLSMWLDRDAHVAFDAHAGGILCGAALAYALRHRGLVHDDFIEEETRAEQRADNEAAFKQALEHIGRLETPKARSLLERIDRDEPGRLDVIVALYRCARYGNAPAQLDAAAARVLAFPMKDDADAVGMKSVYDDYVKACGGQPRLPADSPLRLVAPLLRLDQDAAAEILLRGIAGQAPDCPGLAAAWFAFALHAPEGSPQRRARLDYVLQHHAQSEFAPKARFLLGQG